MPIKILRLGMTEISLLFIYWLKKYKNINNNKVNNLYNSLIKWFYTTSGYYDKKIIGNYMNVIHKTEPNNYILYMETILNFIKNSDMFNFCFHKFDLHNELTEFKSFINAEKDLYITQQIVFNFISGKKILIISPFSPLIKIQLESGNCKLIYENTPSINEIYTYKFPYTFFNNGPDNNIFETRDNVFAHIIDNIENNYESVLISCGAYSGLMAEKFYNIGKNVCVVGGDLQTFFGIMNTRTKKHYNDNNLEIKNKDNWILNIPDEYKPENYLKIENGCYW